MSSEQLGPEPEQLRPGDPVRLLDWGDPLLETREDLRIVSVSKERATVGWHSDVWGYQQMIVPLSYVLPR